MRWCSWTSDELGGTARLGALRQRDGEEWLLDVTRWATSREATVPADLVDLVEASEATRERTAELAATAPDDAPGWLRPSSVRLLAPLRAPNSLRDFLAFRDHVERGAARRGTPVPEPWERIPVYYKGNRRSISGDGDDVRWPSYTERLDYECEIAAVVGRGGRDWTADEAREAIFGYFVMNDWSARDVQRDEMACWLGPAKAKDFNTSFGPVLVTADEWDPEDDHPMTVTVDGEVWSRGTTAGRRWTFGEMLAHVSRDEDVYPTDVLGSGTFGGGCGLDLDRWLVPGQTVTLTVDGLGTLTNRVVR
ncbi:MAG TPA: fumarylacetoacetate hydrolase family protein [Mycobacteriales bacterium]|jgi:2-keto-4-pentenoate hydratase/2-oxohepta-3-ene-1,7-dioic acid hydratase in catechol pathway|nr:fumarylacetoacetate hydrolase family protein [Mycobacteriales bacterium]